MFILFCYMFGINESKLNLFCYMFGINESKLNLGD
jgi:hypothetical protein